MELINEIQNIGLFDLIVSNDLKQLNYKEVTINNKTIHFSDKIKDELGLELAVMSIVSDEINTIYIQFRKGHFRSPSEQEFGTCFMPEMPELYIYYKENFKNVFIKVRVTTKIWISMSEFKDNHHKEIMLSNSIEGFVNII